MNTIFRSKKHEGLVANNGDPITARTWDSGNIDGYSYQALVFPEPSDYGINNGNISKLSIKAPDGKLVVSYDRGWDIEPAGKAAKAILDKVLARYTVEQSSETKCNEAFAVYRGGPGYSSSFMIDCGSPERAKALADAIQEEAYGHPAGSAKDDAGRHFLGGEIIQFWPVDRYFTATVDPCDKAIEWCQEFLKSLDGEISALTGNSAGLESNASEDRRGTDRYGHHVKRFTTKDLKGLDGEVVGDNGADAGTDNKFGLAYLDTTSISAFSNNFSTSARDSFLHDLAQMPVSKKSIEDLLRKHKLHLYGRTVGVRDFFPENGIAYLGTIGDDGLPSKSLYLKWGPALKK